VSFVFDATAIKNHFLLRSASLRASLRRKEKGFSFLYPAFTSQRARKTAPTLTRHAGLLSARAVQISSRSEIALLILLDKLPLNPGF
jgi:hypothetical protein